MSRAAPRKGASHGAFLGVSALVFVASTGATIAWSDSMPATGGMHMPGHWMTSAAWMCMPSQGWTGEAASFLCMWGVMMVAMMLPSLVPMLWRYRLSLAGAGEARLGLPTALAGLGYFLVWTLFGMAVFPLGAALAAAGQEMPALARATPLAAGFVVLAAGAVQFTAWKARHLACCRAEIRDGHPPRPEAGAALQHGVGLGLRCLRCCFGLMAIALVLGMMDLGVMAVVTAAITAERLAPAGEAVAKAIGAAAIGAGSLLIARAMGLA